MAQAVERLLATAAEQQLSPEQAAEAGAVSLTAFGRLFFPRTFRQDSPEFHEEIGAALYSQSRYNAFEIFRDGAKTTTLRVYKAERISYGLSRTIMYVSVSQPHAKMSVRWLRRQVMYNRRWTQTFGLEKGDKWSDEHCEIIHRNMPPNEDGSPVVITVLAMGITGQVRGFNPDDFRPDLIIVDDILDEENTATPDQRKKIENLLFGAILNSLAPRSEAPLAKAVFLQTPFHKEDAIEKCMGDPEWNPLRFGILEYTADHPEGRSRWEQRYPTTEILAAKAAHVRRSQYRLWMREKEVTLVSGEEKTLNIENLKYFEVLPERLDVIVSFDPASSENRKADDFAIGAVGFRGSDVFLLDYFAEPATMPDAAVHAGFQLSMLYNARKWVVESVAFQRIMAWYAREEMKRRRMFYAVEELKIGTKSNADRIMQTLPGLLAFGHLWCRPQHTKFITQADDYDPQVKDIKDDILTMLANAIISSNPAIRQAMGIGGDDSQAYLDDESRYPDLVIGGAP